MKSLLVVLSRRDKAVYDDPVTQHHAVVTKTNVGYRIEIDYPIYGIMHHIKELRQTLRETEDLLDMFGVSPYVDWKEA